MPEVIRDWPDCRSQRSRMFSVLFENGCREGMRSNTLVVGADPHFVALPAIAVPLQVPITILSPRLITIPAAILLPRLIATIPQELLLFVR